MKYNELNVKSNKRDTRVGRGIAAGRGKTAGRGTKGQNARKSGGVRPGFEGGQNPLMQRIPKLRGFTSHRAKVEAVYTGQLDEVGGTIDNFTLFNASLTSSPYVKVKLILKGEVTKKVAVKLQGASQNAVAAVQKAGGSYKQTEQVKRQKQAKKSEKSTK